MTDARHQFLAEASKLLGASLDYETTLGTVAELAVPSLADWCAVDVIEDGELRSVAVAHARPLGAAEPPRSSSATGDRYGVMSVLRSGQSELHEDLGDGSWIVAPLSARGRTLGALTLVSAGPGRRYTPFDLQLAEDLARRAGVAVDNARLYREAESERARLKTVLEQMPSGVVIAEAPNGKVVVNDRVAAIFGRELDAARDDTEYARFAEIFVEEKYRDPRTWPMVRALVGGEQITGEEMTIRRFDGTLAVVSVNAGPARDSTGAIIAAVTTIDDVTERRRAAERERFLGEATTRLAGSLDYEVALAEVAGLAVPRIAGACVVQLLEESGVLRQIAAVPGGEALDGGRVATGGGPELTATSLTVPLEAGGRVLGVLGLRAQEAQRFDDGDRALARELARRAALAVDNARLYAEARRAVAAPEEEPRRLSSLLEQLPAGVMIAEAPSGRIRYCNQQAQEIFDQLGADGASFFAWDPTDKRQYRPEDFPLSRAIAGETVRGQEIAFVRGDGSLSIVRQNAAPIRDPDGRIVAAVAAYYDITEWKRGEEERAELLHRAESARGEAERANRSKDEFLATLSHELRTPLNAMLGWAYMLRTGKLPDGSRQRALETIERNAKLQAQLVEDLLDVSRITAGKLRVNIRRVDLGAVVEGALDAVRPAAAAKSIELAVDAAATAGPLAGDPDRLQQVMWNLLSNAVKFTARGGRVELSVARTSHEVKLVVRDSGRGIAADFLPYVFERFRQADGSITRSHGGLGLGLAIVRHLVELHGGRVRATSPGEGLGAVFTVTLPVRELDENQAGVEEAPGPAPALDGVRVLLVEDDEDARELMATVLEGLGAEVRATGTADEALRELTTFRPAVLVSDIGLPGTDGYELIRRVRALGQERGGWVPAVALTAYAGEEASRKALLAGFQLHVPKPIEPGTLASVVAKLARWIE